MLCFELRFPARRYHATPWSTHVNEGQIEWPPSPWRLTRALLAVGFTRLGWEHPPESAQRLFSKMAERPPRYALPPTALGHSRHYMPIGEKTTKVIDAFAYVGDAPLHVLYEGEFDEEERSLAGELIAHLPYLGRAESWVMGRLVEEEEVPSRDAFECCPLDEEEYFSNLDRIELLAPEPPSRFEQWRALEIEAQLDRLLSEKIAAAEAKGKKPPSKLSKKDITSVEARYPASWLEALTWDTATLQELGWNAPPGSVWMMYRAPDDARPRVEVGGRGVPGPVHNIDTALFALSADAIRSDLYPPMRDALRRMELIHRSLVSLSDPEKKGAGSPALSGKIDGEPMTGHRHAFMIPLALGRRKDRIDHLLVYARMGFDANARRALGLIRKTYAKDMPDLFVTLAGLGAREDFEELVPDVREAARWRSRTPFIPPRYLKRSGKNSLRGQIEAELKERGIEGLESILIELDGGEYIGIDEYDRSMRLTPRFRHFRREREKEGATIRKPALSLELRFREPVRGPIALGYACHFGLGVFEPVFR